VKLKTSHLVILVVFLVLLLDQSSKIWIKMTMVYGQEIHVFGLEWFRLHFTENPGMAFGLELGGNYGKLALSVFRIIAVGFMVYYIKLLIDEKAHKGLIISISLILAGAVGNILDSAFYGLIFSESVHTSVATAFPEGGGYAGFLHGRVVDMLYFPMFEGFYPDWMPWKGGDYFQFFRPVFNIADSSITIGVFMIILFQGRYFKEEDEPVVTDNDDTNTLVEETTDIDDALEASDDVIENVSNSSDDNN
jgi:signal peptidase II